MLASCSVQTCWIQIHWMSSSFRTEKTTFLQIFVKTHQPQWLDFSLMVSSDKIETPLLYEFPKNQETIFKLYLQNVIRKSLLDVAKLLEATIMFIIFASFLTVEHIFYSPQVKRSIIIRNKLVYRMCLTRCRTTNNLGNIREISKPLRIIAWCSVPLPKLIFGLYN